MGIQIYILACMKLCEGGWYNHTINQECKNPGISTKTIQAYGYTVTGHSSLPTSKYADIRLNRSIEKHAGGCRHTTSTYRHASMQPAAWAHSQKKHSRVYKTLKKRKHTDIRTHGHSSKQAYVNIHITTQAHTAAFTSFATLLIKIVILSCNEHNTYNRSST